MELIRLAGLYKTYRRGKVEVPVLRGIDLTIPRRQAVAIVGTSGAGKTRLINLLGLLDAPTAGQHWFHGTEVSQLTPAERTLLRNRHIGFVFQHFNLLPRLTAWQNVMMPLQYTAEGLSHAECRRRARSLLEQVGLGDRLEHRPCHLSGGEQDFAMPAGVATPALPNQGWCCPSPSYLPPTGEIAVLRVTRPSGKQSEVVRRIH